MLLLGIASHRHIVMVPHPWTLRAHASRVWLALGAALSIASAALFAAPKYLRALIGKWL